MTLPQQTIALISELKAEMIRNKTVQLLNYERMLANLKANNHFKNSDWKQLKRSVVNLKDKHGLTYAKIIEDATNAIGAAEAEEPSTSRNANASRKRRRVVIDEDDGMISDEIDGMIEANGQLAAADGNAIDGEEEEEESDLEEFKQKYEALAAREKFQILQIKKANDRIKLAQNFHRMSKLGLVNETLKNDMIMAGFTQDEVNKFMAKKKTPKIVLPHKRQQLLEAASKVNENNGPPPGGKDPSTLDEANN